MKLSLLATPELLDAVHIARCLSRGNSRGYQRDAVEAIAKADAQTAILDDLHDKIEAALAQQAQPTCEKEKCTCMSYDKPNCDYYRAALAQQAQPEMPTREQIAEACQKWMDSPMLEPLELADAVLALFAPKWCSECGAGSKEAPEHWGFCSQRGPIR